MTTTAVVGLDATAAPLPIYLTAGDRLDGAIVVRALDGTPVPLSGTWRIEVYRAPGGSVLFGQDVTPGGDDLNELGFTWSATDTAKLRGRAGACYALRNLADDATVYAGPVVAVPRGRAGVGTEGTTTAVTYALGPQGPAGPTGPQGPTGAPGADGARIG